MNVPAVEHTPHFPSKKLPLPSSRASSSRNIFLSLIQSRNASSYGWGWLVGSGRMGRRWEELTATTDSSSWLQSSPPSFMTSTLKSISSGGSDGAKVVSGSRGSDTEWSLRSNLRPSRDACRTSRVVTSSLSEMSPPRSISTTWLAFRLRFHVCRAKLKPGILRALCWQRPLDDFEKKIVNHVIDRPPNGRLLAPRRFILSDRS